MENFNYSFTTNETNKDKKFVTLTSFLLVNSIFEGGDKQIPRRYINWLNKKNGTLFTDDGLPTSDTIINNDTAKFNKYKDFINLIRITSSMDPQLLNHPYFTPLRDFIDIDDLIEKCDKITQDDQQAVTFDFEAYIDSITKYDEIGEIKFIDDIENLEYEPELASAIARDTYNFIETINNYENNKQDKNFKQDNHEKNIVK